MPRTSLSLTLLCASLSPYAAVCNVTQTQPSEQLQAIVDLNDVLEETKPAAFAAMSLKNVLQQNAMPWQKLPTHNQPDESKTGIFNKSMLSFIKQIYNHKNYATQLSQNAGHILQFLDLSNELALGPDGLLVSLRLFYNKMKAAEVIDAPMIIQILDATPHYLERYFIAYDLPVPSNDLTYLKKHLEKMILSKFRRDVDIFHHDPDQFVTQLSSELARYYQDQTEQVKAQAKKQESTERLRNLLIRFYDLSLNKIMWDPQQSSAIWPGFNTLAQGLQMLGEYGIIKHMDELDDLFWSLTHRFSYFLEIAGSQLPMTFYEQVNQDLEAGAVYFLEYQEQDEGIVSKKDTIKDALTLAKARAIAYEQKGVLARPKILQQPRLLR